jgi:hypothetical protein
MRADDDCMSDQGFRCRFCGKRLSAWLPVPQVPHGAMLLGHRSPRHPMEVGRFLEQMRTTLLSQADEVIR